MVTAVKLKYEHYIITLTTGFGLTDSHVTAMKGVILGINPEAKIVDICHNIEPQNIGRLPLS